MENQARLLAVVSLSGSVGETNCSQGTMCLDSEKKKLLLYYKHVIEMSSRKIRGKFNQLVFSEVCLKHLKVI